MAQKILVIDDPQTAADVAENVFARHFPGCDVLVAPRGIDAFERLNAASPDLVLLNDTLPDADAGVILARLAVDPFSANIPVLLLADASRTQDYNGKFPNIARVLTKPASMEALTEAVGAILGGKALSRRMLPGRAGGVVFSGHTGIVSLQQALHMAQGDRLTGVLRFQLGRQPIELWMNAGRFLFATTRNFQLYCGGSPVILAATNLGLIVEAQMNQQITGCPIFLFLSVRNGFPHEDVVQITRDHGQRLFSHLHSAGRITFEFEEATVFPDYVENFPAGGDDADNWMLGSLRHVKFDQLAPAQRPDPGGSPAYTRRGYDLVQRLKLNDTEARFASAINGSESLQVIAQRLGIPMGDALMIVFRFQALEIIDFWNAGALALPLGS
ncbi:MAG: response regulator [Chthoniobacteraceae bacterium]